MAPAAEKERLSAGDQGLCEIGVQLPTSRVNEGVDWLVLAKGAPCRIISHLPGVQHHCAHQRPRLLEERSTLRGQHLGDCREKKKSQFILMY